MKRKARKDLTYGWTLFIIESSGTTYKVGMARNLEEGILKLVRRGHGKGQYPYKLLFEEKEIPFKEASAKYEYMKRMNRYLKSKLIRTKKWPFGGAWKEYVISQGLI